MYLCLLFMKNKACLQNASIISQKEEKLNEKGTIAVKYYDNNQPTMHFCPKVCGSPPHLSCLLSVTEHVTLDSGQENV